ncbi:MAG: arginase family protein [Bacillota bacterium]|nr:arginase family protein [Bacillota bacterium]
MNKQLNLFYPQWQGGGQDRSTYFGALELKLNYLKGMDLSEVEVSLHNVKEVKNDIFAYDEILAQMEKVRALLDDKKPDKIFTIGGGCDAGILPLSYLNQKLNGDLTVLWFDGHGDINSPLSSKSKHFYGMPVRVLLGESDSRILDFTYLDLLPQQLLMLGLRNLDEPENKYIKKHKIAVLGVAEIENNLETVIASVKAKRNHNIYIHLDLDVLDPEEFPYIPVPSPGGLKVKTLSVLLDILNKEFNLSGLGLFAYQPSGITSIGLIEEVVRIGTGITGPA